MTDGMEQKAVRKNLLIRPLNSEPAISDALGDGRSFRSKGRPSLSSRISVLAKVFCGLVLCMGLSLWGQNKFVLVTRLAKCRMYAGGTVLRN